MNELRYIAKCKACNCVTSALSTVSNARCRKDDAWRTAPAGVYTLPAGHVVLDCRSCGKPRHANAVSGKVSMKHQCNAKCLASTSGKCECSCGGKNHGASYAA